MSVLHFKGKSVIQNHHHTVKFHELKVDVKKGLTKEPSLDDNLIVHGDNLTALKALLPIYASKIKCIYIDPPYNTGNEGWRYNDNVNSSMIKEWLDKEVGRDDLARHDKWCCMMYPRLSLLRELLRDDGFIFVSVDDNEVYHLREIMNEVFGEPNFVTQMVWNTEGHTDNQFDVKVNHEYVIAFAKDANKASLEHVVDPNVRKESNLWKGFAENSITKNGSGNPPSEITLPMGFPCNTEEVNLEKTTVDPSFFQEVSDQGFISRAITKKFGVAYPIRLDRIVCKSGVLTSECRVFSGWANVNKLKQFIATDFQPIADDNGDKISFYLSTNGVIYYKKQREKARNILSVLRNMGTTEQMRSELEQIGINFQYPKPKQLIKYLIQIGCNGDGIVLDSFAGSGTTAHSVLELNAQDGGSRKFVLIELEDYANEITAERVRRVIKGVSKSEDEALKKGLGGSFSYYELGDPIDIDEMLEGKNLPSYEDLAHYTFFTATGESFDPREMKKAEYYLGTSSAYELFMLYEPDAKKLRELALNLEFADAIEKKFPAKPKLVFAPASFLEEFDLRDRNIRFAQLPFEIYRLAD